MRLFLLRFLVFAIVLVSIFGFFSKDEQPRVYEGYQLVWSDEFNNNGEPNRDNWNYETGFVRNLEAQWYQKENAYCKDGFLIIEAKKEKRLNPNFVAKDHKNWTKNRDSISVTSSCLITRGKHSWQYGRFEICAKIPVEKGMWPAFWTLGVSGNWPANGEIDIMEYYRGKLLANVAWKSETDKVEWDSHVIPLVDFGKDNWANEFHIWRMDWNENEIKLYVDNQLINETIINDKMQLEHLKNHPFRQPHYVLLNLAVGGNEGGAFEDDSFPSQYIVDYIRVYQKK
ncbi:glycoside hydrolase family 16 protein [Flavobacterium sp. MAHUQ-51]|uniref:glycoside hydrolase family 16 protein n=1 Tax=Flavobacterium sp. GCM10022190 TaxID=3252639 RepID=UPI0036131F39